MSMSPQCNSLIGVHRCLSVLSKWNALIVLLLLTVWVSGLLGQELRGHTPARNHLQIQSVLVDGKLKRWNAGQSLRLGSRPAEVTFNFGPATNSSWQPTRLRYKLEGYDSSWREGQAAMCLTIRF